ncbi:helix-turn-helix domain-containing protein [Burkholderia contaminans]|uniref:helix-turn-helix domain-containing protein n=1 Tax=Burkholderia contaminans TaxID=488447 RepID=UPI0031331F36
MCSAGSAGCRTTAHASGACRARCARSAQALIAQGRLSIEEIAQNRGFSGTSSFSQAYRRWTGVAPSVPRQGAGL